MKRITFLASLIMFFSAHLLAQDWVVAVVDSPGIRPSIAVDSEGNPHLIYFEYGYGGGAPFLDTTHVMYAVWDPGSGVFVRESTILSGIHPIGELTLDPNDVPHFVYHTHRGGGNATYATFDGVGWVHDPIFSDGHDGFGPSIFLDAGNNPHVSFINGSSIDDPDGVGIEYGFFNGSDWVVETVGTEPELSHHSGTSIGLNLTGEPSIAYYDSVGKALMLATRENGVWSIEMVDDVGDPGRFSSMKFDSQGFPRIAYLDKLSTTSGIVRLATMTPSGWTFQNLDTLYSILVNDSASVVRSRAPVGVEGVISLVLNSTEQVLVAYSDSHKVTLASVNGLEVTRETVFEYVADEGALGMTTSLALDSEDQPHIAFYFDYGDSVGTVLYARREDDPLAGYSISYGSTGSAEPNYPGYLITIDPLTGAGTLIGPTGIIGDAGPSVPAIAIKSTGEMYAVSASVSSGLYTLNASTGVGTLVANLGLSLPSAMAFDRTDDLFIVDGADDLYSVDETTGAAALIGPLGFDARGIAFDPTDGMLYGSSGTDEIYTIDPLTGTSTLVGSTGLGGTTPDIHFDQEGNLFGTKLGAGALYDLISIDKQSGAGTTIGPIGFTAVIGLSARLTAYPSQVELLSPPAGEVIEGSEATFLWNTSGPLVDRYWFELSEDSLFSSPIIDSTITDSTTTILNFETGNYWWRVRAHNAAGWGSFSEIWNFSVLITDVGDEAVIPSEFSLSQNYPNPFNPATTFRYGLPQSSHARLEVFNMLGQIVRTIVDEHQVAGYYEAVWDGRNEAGAVVSSGIYIYRMRAGSLVETRRMMLIK